MLVRERTLSNTTQVCCGCPNFIPGPQGAKLVPVFFVHDFAVELGHQLGKSARGICFMVKEHVPQVRGCTCTNFHGCVFPYLPAPSCLPSSVFSVASCMAMLLPTKERHSPWLTHRRETTMALPKPKNSVCEYRDTTCPYSTPR